MAIPAVGLQGLLLGRKYRISDPAVLDRIAACGYRALECVVEEPKTFKAMLDERGLACGGMHANLRDLADLDPLIEKLRILACRDVCNSGVYVWKNVTADDYHRGIAAINEAGRGLREAGIALHYHNHTFEFEKTDGERTGMDILLDELDPSCVDLCVDVGWVFKAGLDPVAFLAGHRDRVGYLHLRDFDRDGSTELGSGMVDLAGVVRLLPSLPGLRQVMCEQDSSRIDPLDSVEKSRRYLKETLGY